MKKFIFDIQRFDEFTTVPFGSRDASISSGITITDGTLASGSDNADTFAVSSPNGNNDNAFFRSNAVISLRGGNDSVDIKNGINQSSVTITGNDNDDTINVAGTSYAIVDMSLQNLSPISIDGGNGNDGINLIIDSSSESSIVPIVIMGAAVTVTGAEGNDTISISGGTVSTGAAISGGYSDADVKPQVSISGGAGEDNIFIYSGGYGILTGAAVSIDGDSEKDLVSISGGLIGITGSNVSINGGKDADTISVTGTYYAMQFSTVTVDGGEGDDFLYIYGGTDGIHPSKVTLSGGNGSDTIEIHGGNEAIHGGIAEAVEDKTAASLDGGEGDDSIIIHADNEKGIDISNVTITGGVGNDLISIYGGTYGIGGVSESLNSIFSGSGDIAATVSITGGDGADTISVSAIDSISGGTVTITAGSGDVISVGSGGAYYLFDSTDAVTINGAIFTSNAANISASLESSADSTSIRSEWSGTVAISDTNSLADIDGSIVSAAGIYQVVDGRFTSFDTITPDTTPSVTPEPTPSVTSDTASVNVQVVNAVDLNLVPDGMTGYFIAQINSDSAFVTPIFKTESPAENDTLCGNVIANKIYCAENNHGGQTVTIPSSWNVTATENNDTLNVRGTNVTVTGGASSDLFALSEEVGNIRINDLTPSEDNLSFANYIQPGSMRQSFDDNHLVLTADNLRVDLPGMSAISEEFLDYSVSNAGSSSTIRELLYGDSTTSSNYISFAHWTFGFENSSGF